MRPQTFLDSPIVMPSVSVFQPLRKTRDPDLTYIVKATEQIAQHLRPGQLVVLESTTYPGTTMEIVAPKLAVSGLKVGEDVHLAFSPERIDPENETFTVENTPKIIGGVSRACSEAASTLYGAIVNSVIPVSSPTAAEMVKAVGKYISCRQHWLGERDRDHRG